MGNDHRRWLSGNDVHLPCKYIILTNLRRFYCDLVDRYGISVSQMTTDMFYLS